MAFRMSEQPRTIKIYNLLARTNEFIGEGDAYIPPHTGLPANSTDIAPPDIPAGFVAVFNSDEASWHLVEDHRGKTVYDVASGDALFISELGPLPENVTWFVFSIWLSRINILYFYTIHMSCPFHFSFLYY